jgi:glyoxylase-like metal-dependent hydrolase (beta-lactamase superfamily II)
MPTSATPVPPLSSARSCKRTVGLRARHGLVPGPRSLGLDPSTIKYVVVTHTHGDRFGGAQYLADIRDHSLSPLSVWSTRPLP